MLQLNIFLGAFSSRFAAIGAILLKCYTISVLKQNKSDDSTRDMLLDVNFERLRVVARQESIGHLLHFRDRYILKIPEEALLSSILQFLELVVVGAAILRPMRLQQLARQ